MSSSQRSALHLQQQQQQNADTPTKTLTRLLATPSNRCCADCRSTLVDLNQTYASYSPSLTSVKARHQYTCFTANHEQFAPPEYKKILKERHRSGDGSNGHGNNRHIYANDPCLSASTYLGGGHGVFVCAACGAAHKLLGPSVSVVHSVQDQSAWTAENISLLQAGGGNARSWQLLEAYIPAQWKIHMKPNAASGIADRLTFIRAKYEALAFCLPPTGPLASQAWVRILERHPEWSNMWGGSKIPSFKELQIYGSMREASLAKLLPGGDVGIELPNRLVDYFCVISPGDALDPSLFTTTDNTMAPTELALVPQVTSCYPPQDTYPDTDFPTHVGSFVLPEGCRPSVTPDAPAFFTFVLTASDGSRLYGGALRLYDTLSDTSFLRKAWQNSRPKDDMPSWLSDGAGTNDAGNSRGSSESLEVVYLPKVLVVLSHYPFFDLWRKFLLQIYRIALVEAPLPIERFVTNFCSEVPLPPPGRIQVKFAFTVKEPWMISRPPGNKLPLANFSFRPLFASLSIGNVMLVWACLLQETRVALLSSHYSVLCPVAEALLSLLFPLHWQGIFLPILPYTMLDVLDAPVPFLVGLHSRYLSQCNPTKRPKGVVYVDLDNDVVHLGFDDNCLRDRAMPAIPERLALKLKTRLDACAASAYILPSSRKAGSVTTGTGTPVLYIHRCPYAHINSAEIPNNGMTRKQILSNTDRAYRDNDFLVPLTGFLSEHGQFHSQDMASSTTMPKSRSNMLNPFRRSNRSGGPGHFRRRTFGESSSEHHNLGDIAKEADVSDINLLDLEDPPEFSSEDIRDAFLRFFVTLFKDYRECIIDSTFNNQDYLTHLSLGPDSLTFMEAMLGSQMFSRFIEDRLQDPECFDSEVMFFEDTINAKYNRMRKMTLNLTARRSTTFLDDKTGEISETYSPPPPSNWGLPDDNRTYHYGSFPDLNSSLYGKVRPPMRWPVDKKDVAKDSRKASVMAQVNEQAIISKALKPLFDTPSALLSATRRNLPSLEVAIGALSIPYASPVIIPRANLQNNQTTSSMVPRFRRESNSFLNEESTLKEETAELDAELATAAEEIVYNARRKQVILLGINVKLQSICRMHIAKIKVARMRSDTFHANYQQQIIDAREGLSYKQMIAATKIQCQLRLLYFRVMFLRLRKATVKAQAIIRGRRVKFAYYLLVSALSKLQARCRGFVLRVLYRKMFDQRLTLYRHHIFMLWNISNTPLSYRTKFWPILLKNRVLRLVLAEREIPRLWKQLKILFDDDLSSGERGNILRLDDKVYRKCVEIHKSLINDKHVDRDATLPPSSNNKDARNFLTPHSSNSYELRLLSERTQAYDRLCFVDADGVVQMYNLLCPAAKQEHKKVTISETLWRDYTAVNESVNIMLQLFPELQYSTNICYREPSKKGTRRLKPTDHVFLPLPQDMLAHTFLDSLIRQRMKDVASQALIRVPSLIVLLANATPKNRILKIRQQQAIMASLGGSDWTQCRLELMRQYFCLPDGKLACKTDPAIVRKSLHLNPEMPLSFSPSPSVAESFDTTQSATATTKPRRRLRFFKANRRNSQGLRNLPQSTNNETRRSSTLY